MVTSAKLNTSDRVVSIIFYAIALLFAIACLFPFILVIISSLTDEATLVRNGYMLVPEKWSLNAYKSVFTSNTIYSAYGVSIFTTGIGSLLSLCVTSMGAYALSGGKMKYRNKLAFFFYFTMLFSGGLVPNYILISKYLGLRDNIWVYILPALLNPWNMFLLRNFFNEIPIDLKESAYIEGAGEARVLYSIILPLSTPALATIALFYAISYWNDWLTAVLYISDDHLQSLQYVIMKIIRNIEAATKLAAQATQTGAVTVPPSYTIRLATAIITIGPIVLLYPFLQKYFVAGLRAGGVKG